LVNSGKAAATGTPVNHVFPFLTSTLDLAKWIGIPIIKWHIYASYSRQSPLIADNYSTLSAFNLAPAPGTALYNYTGFNPYQQYNSYQAGTSVGILENLSVSYTTEFKNYVSFDDIPPFNANGFFFNALVPFNGKIITNRFAMNYDLKTPLFTWSASLNGTESRLQVIDNPALAATYNAAYLDAGHRWTGGYTNRLDYKVFFAGLDALYQAGERPNNLLNAFATSPTYIAPSNKNSFTVQNFYFGARLKIPHLSYAEIYVNSRNILQNNGSDITDGRRFYGAGFKCGL
jgi:hypothetical protein